MRAEGKIGQKPFLRRKNSNERVTKCQRYRNLVKIVLFSKKTPLFLPFFLAPPLAPPPPHIFTHGGANFFLDGGAMGGDQSGWGGAGFAPPPR